MQLNGNSDNNFKYCIAVPVWGKSYVDTFLSITLPTLMSPGNLPYLMSVAKVNMDIYTSQDDAPSITNHPLIQRLRKKLNFKIKLINTPNGKTKSTRRFRSLMYNLKGNIYSNNISLAQKDKKSTLIAISLNADIVFSDNFFTEAHSIILSGKKVIEVACPRGKAQEIKKTLYALSKDTDGSISINAHNLLETWIDNFHPLLEIHLWNGNSETFNCSHLLWPFKSGKGWLARCFYLYPIVLVIPKQKVSFVGTIDRNLVHECGYGINDSAIITHQDKMFCCELSEDDKFVGIFGLRKDYQSIAYQYRRYGNSYNLALLEQDIMLGITDRDNLTLSKNEAYHEIMNIKKENILYLNNLTFIMHRLYKKIQTLTKKCFTLLNVWN